MPEQSVQTMTTWCQYIRKDLKARIAAGREVPDDLTLTALAARYAVSLTPVRAAVGALVDEGYLERLDNGRLAVNRSKVGTRRQAADDAWPEPPKDHFDEVANDVIVLCLRGDVRFLREEETASRYGISGTAIRQVFSRLAGAGVLEHVPRRGWRVRPFRRKQMREYTRVRKVLELEAMKLAWPKLLDEDLWCIYHGNVLPKTPDEDPIIDDGLHRYLIDKADNEYIRDFFDRHERFFVTVFTWEGADREAAIETVHQHRAILAAMLARDRRAARKALLEHLNYGHGLLKRVELVPAL